MVTILSCGDFVVIAASVSATNLIVGQVVLVLLEFPSDLASVVALALLLDDPDAPVALAIGYALAVLGFIFGFGIPGVSAMRECAEGIRNRNFGAVAEGFMGGLLGCGAALFGLYVLLVLTPLRLSGHLSHLGDWLGYGALACFGPFPVYLVLVALGMLLAALAKDLRALATCCCGGRISRTEGDK